MEARTVGSEVILQFVNFTGLTGTFAVPAKTFDVTVNLAPGVSPVKLEVASPDTSSAPQALAFTRNGSQITLSLTLIHYSMVILTV